jgi:hypothetical protein
MESKIEKDWNEIENTQNDMKLKHTEEYRIDLLVIK